VIELALRLPRRDFTLDVALALPARGTTALFGPSGCGKTTLLRAIAGLERAAGRVIIDGEAWQDDGAGIFVPPHRRALGYVIQESALFPHLDVAANLAYGRRRSGADARRVDLQAVVELLDIAGLMRRRPATLSGGERQRVAIARALATGPRLLLLDDPHDDDPEAAPDEAPAAPARAEPVDEARLLDWLARIVERDARALAALYDALLPRVYGLVLRIVRRPAWAEEAVEDCFFQVWRHALRFDPARGGALPWVLSIARSRAIDLLRREMRFQHDSLDDEGAPEQADEVPAADELLDSARDHAALHRALMGLSARSRQLVALSFFRGLSHEEIADQTALPLGTVKSQIRRAMIALRDRLGEAGPPALAEAH
jgi:RNA polymerase sigma factor (sigma-70 family)